MSENPWHTISTAPRDGTIVDLWHTMYGRLTDCWWDAEDQIWVGGPQDKGDDFVTHWLRAVGPDGSPMFLMRGEAEAVEVAT